MSGVKHTPGPWKVRGTKPVRLNMDSDTRFWVIQDREGYSPALVPPWDAVPPLAAEEAGANATRIVDCLNALEGIENPAAFRKVFGELVEVLGNLANAAGATSSFASPMILQDAQTTLAKAKDLQS